MPKKKGKPADSQENKAAKARSEGWLIVRANRLLRPVVQEIDLIPQQLPRNCWAYVNRNGRILCNDKALAEPREWAWVFAHCALHLAFQHHERIPEKQREWNAACCCIVDRFVKEVGVGKPPPGYESHAEEPGKVEEKLYDRFCRDGLPANAIFGTAGGAMDLTGDAIAHRWSYSGWRDVDWSALFAEGLSEAVSSAINLVAGESVKESDSPAEKARRWFINSYPLLGAMAAGFKLIENPQICHRESVPIAAVNAELKEMYINPAAGLDELQMRFVMAHEFLHVGLRHHLRCQGRDGYLWNVACDFVINHWLVEMQVGSPPFGVLIDEQLKGLSAESIYDVIVKDLRKYRKLATLRGNCGEGDMIEKRHPSWWDSLEGTTLDEWYRRALAEGLAFHESSGRGLLPAGLTEEIRALTQPAVPWDVELANWFDHHFPPIETRRSYARPSRRQSATPDIPRARYVKDVPEDSRTFGVVIDTSGSMSRLLLGKALGAIASYSIARDVPFVRVVFCDAAPYDQGYMPPEEIAGRVTVKGRGGTVLQPAIDLLEETRDFPDKGPILIITDADCDFVKVKRDHAFLIPDGVHLPFKTTGDVFRLK